MSSWFSNFRRRRRPDVETQLRASRPEPSQRLVKSIATRINPRPAPAVRSRTRIGVVALVTATMVAVVGATGGFSSAASSILGASHSVVHVVSSPGKAPQPNRNPNPGNPSAACSQYVPPPVVSGFTPAQGVAGTQVTVTGSHFTGNNGLNVSSVTLNGTSAVFSIQSTSQLTFTVPAGASSGLITLTNCSGSGDSATSFTVLAGPPSVTGAAPNPGGVGTTIAITGTNLLGATSVTFNKKAGQIVGDTSGEVDAVVPVGAKSGNIVVTTAAGASNGFAFTVLSNAPTLTSFKPTSGLPNDSSNPITLHGTNLLGATSVGFAGGASAAPTNVTKTSADVVVPNGAVTGPITITTPNGVATSKSSFTVLGTPNVTSLSPNGGKVGTTVTLGGSNLGGAASVSFNGTSTKASVKNGVVSAKVPKGATTGPVEVTNTAGQTSAGGPTFTILTAAAALTSASPNHGVCGDTITINGTNMLGPTGVTFGKSAASFSGIDAASISATIPSGLAAGSTTIVVTNAVGKSNALPFTVDPGCTPVVLGFSPAFGKPGSKVQIFGAFLAGATDVHFGSIDAGKPTFKNGLLTTTVPKKGTTPATGYVITVFIGAAAGDSGTDVFTVVSAPKITGPATAAHGTTVGVTGSGFLGTTSVKSGKTSLAFHVNDDGHIDIDIPSGMKLGKASITISNAAGKGTWKPTIT